MTESALTDTLEAPPRQGGWQGFFADWASDQRAFKSATWGKAMVWIFLLSDTFIFSCFLLFVWLVLFGLLLLTDPIESNSGLVSLICRIF